MATAFILDAVAALLVRDRVPVECHFRCHWEPNRDGELLRTEPCDDLLDRIEEPLEHPAQPITLRGFDGLGLDGVECRR